jgi:hypothetical protein
LTKRPVNQTPEQELAEARETIAHLRDRCEWLEQSKNSEYKGRLDAVEQLGRAKAIADKAQKDSAFNLSEADRLRHRLAFAEGFITARTGANYPFEQAAIDDANVELERMFRP